MYHPKFTTPPFSNCLLLNSRFLYSNRIVDRWVAAPGLGRLQWDLRLRSSAKWQNPHHTCHCEEAERPKQTLVPSEIATGLAALAMTRRNRRKGRPRSIQAERRQRLPHSPIVGARSLSLVCSSGRAVFRPSSGKSGYSPAPASSPPDSPRFCLPAYRPSRISAVRQKR